MVDLYLPEAICPNPAFKMPGIDLDIGLLICRGISLDQRPFFPLCQHVQTLAGTGDHPCIVRAGPVRPGEYPNLFLYITFQLSESAAVTAAIQTELPI